MPEQKDTEAPQRHSTDRALTQDATLKRGPPLKPNIADADKIARTGSKDESVRNTPPAGDWNDVASD
jgi:hypothetical protein